MKLDLDVAERAAQLRPLGTHAVKDHWSSSSSCTVGIEIPLLLLLLLRGAALFFLFLLCGPLLLFLLFPLFRAVLLFFFPLVLKHSGSFTVR